ncbi:multicopper oxidase domain-containing protein, partial [Jatrophihabitans endophyticus]|uniref:multicopper oxidase domain-containing protein n=1 Tax=Jatrophihabitans endophyticus TaxID=1206085 RepID=UPI0019ED40E6
MNRSRWARIAGALALVAASCTGVVAPADASGPSPARAGRTATITIKQNGELSGFSPKKLTVTRGTRVVVANHDSMHHTMTSVARTKGGKPLFNTPLPPHSTTTVKGVTGLAAGTYAFYCAIHPNMRGTLVVKGGPGGTTGSSATFRQPLVVPRTLTGSSIHIPVEKHGVRMLPTGPATTMWTFGGSYPGPTITEPAGHATTVTFDDKLPASTGSLTVHLHGDHHSSADDGQPAAVTGDQTNTLLEPGHSLAYHYALTDSADDTGLRGGIDFYHDHSMGRTARNNWNGLQGMFVVKAPIESTLHLPSGRYDVPLMVSDRSFGAGNHLKNFSVAGPPPGDTTVGGRILVDGRYLPYLRVSARRYRLRLLNTSDYQSYDFALSDGQTFDQIGNGDGLLPRSVQRKDIILGPAQRADVLVDFAKQRGRKIVLRSIPSTDHAPGAIGSPSAPLLQFRVGTKRVSDPSAAPTHLQPPPTITVPKTVAQTWDFGLRTHAAGGPTWTVNGQPYDPATVMHEVTEGSTELWMLRNDTKVTHYIHLHEEAWHTVAVFDAKGHRHAPPPWEDGLEDTWRLDPGTAVEVAARFTDHPGVFMIHCHMLDHEDDGMMAQFAVVKADDPQLPAGYRYQPLSGRHRLLTSATTAMGSMPGMSPRSATRR